MGNVPVLCEVAETGLSSNQDVAAKGSKSATLHGVEFSRINNAP